MINFDDLFKRRMKTPIQAIPMEKDDVPSLLDECYSGDDIMDKSWNDIINDSWGDGDSGDGGE